MPEPMSVYDELPDEVTDIVAAANTDVDQLNTTSDTSNAILCKVHSCIE